MKEPIYLTILGVLFLAVIIILASVARVVGAVLGME